MIQELYKCTTDRGSCQLAMSMRRLPYRAVIALVVFLDTTNGEMFDPKKNKVWTKEFSAQWDDDHEVQNKGTPCLLLLIVKSVYLCLGPPSWNRLHRAHRLLPSYGLALLEYFRGRSLAGANGWGDGIDG